MQIIKYEINKNILTVGFKQDTFVVYSQIVYDSTKTEPELLQIAYIQCKDAIDYEATQADHSIITDETGDEFVPEISKPITIIIDKGINYFSCLQTGNLTQQFVAKVYDQYGNSINNAIVFTLDTTPLNVTLNNGLLSIGQLDNDYDLILIVNCDGIIDTLPIYLKKYIVTVMPVKTDLEIAQNNIASLNNTLNQFIDYIFTNIPDLP